MAQSTVQAQPAVQWPTSAVATDSNDLLSPLETLLVNMNVLEPTDIAGNPQSPTLWSTPFGLQAITSGSTSISKWVGTIITGLGGTSTVLTAISSFVAAPDNTAKVVGLAAAASACLIATIIGLAVILRADLAGRAEASAAEYAARAAIATQFLALGRPNGQYFVKEPGYEKPFRPVQSFVLEDGQIAVKVDDTKPLKGDQIEGLVPLG